MQETIKEQVNEVGYVMKETMAGQCDEVGYVMEVQCDEKGDAMKETLEEQDDLVAKVFSFMVILFVVLSLVPIALSF